MLGTGCPFRNTLCPARPLPYTEYVVCWRYPPAFKFGFGVTHFVFLMMSCQFDPRAPFYSDGLNHRRQGGGGKRCGQAAGLGISGAIGHHKSFQKLRTTAVSNGIISPAAAIFTKGFSLEKHRYSLVLSGLLISMVWYTQKTQRLLRESPTRFWLLDGVESRLAIAETKGLGFRSQLCHTKQVPEALCYFLLKMKIITPMWLPS